ncbi:MAG: radical SAM protein [Elusimicrobia bacterium]|nr:radical SAM protein [Elusimicrobiota bacterium]
MEPVRAVLDREGWTLSSRTEAGKLRFVVDGARGRVCELILERPAAHGPVASVAPSFRLRVRGGGRLNADQKRAVAELSSGLRLILDSLRPRVGARSRPEAEVRAQTESHEGYQGFDLLLRTTLACNQRCPFCCVPPSRGRVSAESLEAELSVLARRLGPKGTLTLSGGEPLVDPGLTRLLESARGKGISRFVLQTNAVGLDRPGVIEKLASLGVRHFFVSFHSHRPGAYDRVTGSRGLYPRAVQALKRLFSGSGYGVTCNVVVNAWNFRDLPGLMRFLARLVRSCKGRGKGSVDVFFSMINGVGLAKAPESGVDLAAAAPLLREAVAVCEKEGLKVQPFAAEAAMPLCLLSHPAKYASRRPLGQDRVSYAEDTPGGRGIAAPGVIGRVKRLACRECRFDPRCLGVPVEYARLFGLVALESRP